MVSIHASVKDATNALATRAIMETVSIHASVKDATKRFRIGSTLKSFNPRICKRCDSVRLYLRLLRLMFQSTHL